MTTTFGLPKSDKGAKGHALFFTQVTEAINALETADTNSTNLFDANSILAATSDNTPTARTIAEDRIVGRKTGGAIGALTPAEVGTIIFSVDQTVAEGSDLVLGTTTGTKIGTGGTQKLGFYGATPVVQQTGVAVSDAAIHAALVNLGLITA
jgi:hypothetical protein